MQRLSFSKLLPIYNEGAIMHNRFNILIHHYVTRGATGTNMFLVQLLEALDRSRFNVKLLIYGEADANLLTQLKRYTSEIEYWHLPFLTRIFSTFFRLITGFVVELLVVRRLRQSKKIHLIFSTNPIITPIISDIAYVHYPSFNQEAFVGLYSIFTLANRTLNRLYGVIFVTFLSLLNRIVLTFFNKQSKNVLYLTNSVYTAKIIGLYCRKRSIVVHPPVDVKSYSRACGDNRLRTHHVVTISRFAYEKRLHIIPLIAKLVKIPVTFIIIGTMKGRMGAEVEDIISKLSKKLGVEDRIRLKPNASEAVKITTLCSSKIYLHTSPNEPYGITVVEAMASGLPVVVPDSGGPYEDIICFGKYGIAYNSVEHAAKIIEMLVSDEKLWERYSTISRVRVLNYDFDVFKSKINMVMLRYLHLLKSTSS